MGVTLFTMPAKPTELHPLQIVLPISLMPLRRYIPTGITRDIMQEKKMEDLVPLLTYHQRLLDMPVKIMGFVLVKTFPHINTSSYAQPTKKIKLQIFQIFQVVAV